MDQKGTSDKRKNSSIAKCSFSWILNVKDNYVYSFGNAVEIRAAALFRLCFFLFCYAIPLSETCSLQSALWNEFHGRVAFIEVLGFMFILFGVFRLNYPSIRILIKLLFPIQCWCYIHQRFYYFHSTKCFRNVGV